MKKLFKLTQEQFDFIAGRCDAVLKEYENNISIIGIAWLHVLNSHPANQIKYVHVFYKRPFIESAKIFVKRFSVILSDLVLSLFGFLSRNHNRISPDSKILIISHLVNALQTKNEPDFYFRELPDFLQQRNYKTTVALLNHTKNYKEIPFKNDAPQKILIPKRLTFYQECKLIFQSVSNFFFFLRQAWRQNDPIQKSFFYELSFNVFSADTIRAFRIYETVKSLIENSDTRILAFTWEGHSWERLLCYAAKNAGKKVYSIAYQHTILFPSSHAVMRTIGNEYDPSLVLTVGSVTNHTIKQAYKDTGVEVMEYGSPRLTAKRSYMVEEKKPNGCLVAPEGLISECIILFGLGIEAAKLMPGISFIFRTHPTIRFEDIQAYDERLKQLPSNVIISTFKNIDDDFKRCSWLLYRSSSVSFFAILAGLRPVYLQLKNELSIDPLFMLNDWRIPITNASDLIPVIKKDQTLTQEEKSTEIKNAVSFSETYMLPYNMPLFEEIVSRVMSAN